jgi:hypothetical protein
VSGAPGDGHTAAIRQLEQESSRTTLFTSPVLELTDAPANGE